jgi:hypothetical protein
VKTGNVAPQAEGQTGALPAPMARDAQANPVCQSGSHGVFFERRRYLATWRLVLGERLRRDAVEAGGG